MIKAVNISKKFGDMKAVDDVTAIIAEGNVFGLIGTNGAGKSTFLRLLSGILKPDKGTITIDEMLVFENPEAKKRFTYISDEQYYFANATPKDSMEYYRKVYERFDKDRFFKMLSQFELDKNRKINTFSKGMKKQLSVICGICANTEYLFCDETFDGLDPVMRQAVKSIFAKEITERNMTPVIASHNLRELEDICDHVGLLHKGEILLSKDLLNMKTSIHKIQCVFKNDTDFDTALSGLKLVKKEMRGSLYTLILRGEQEILKNRFNQLDAIFYEILPLSLEEIFIYETGVEGYDIQKLIF